MSKFVKFTVFIGFLGVGYWGWSNFWNGSVSTEGGSTETAIVNDTNEGSSVSSDKPKKGSLLSFGERTIDDIRKEDNQIAVRSPAYEKETFTDEEFTNEANAYVEKYNLGESEQHYKDLFPNNGLGQKLKLELVLKNQPMVEGDPWPNPKGFELQRSIQESIRQNPEIAVVTYSKALAQIPKEMKDEREHIIQQISKIGSISPQAESDVKKALIAEMKRSGDPAQSVNVLTQLLSVKQDATWVKEVEEAYETAFPGSRVSEFVAIQEH